MRENNCVILTPNECDGIEKKNKLKLKFQTTEQGGAQRPAWRGELNNSCG